MNVSANLIYRMRNRRRHGFTLIEILVASAVMALLVGLVITITSQVLNVWNRSGGRLSANQEARIAMEMLTQDLETAVFRNRRSAADDSEWFFLRNVEIPGASSINTVALKLFSPALDRPAPADEPGDICAISYELKQVDLIGSPATGQPRFALFRQLNDPQSTFDTMLGGSIDAWGNNISEEDYLVANIVEFNIRLYQANGDLITGNPFVFDGLPSTPVPAFADIKLRVLSSEGANILQGRGSAVNLDDLIREHATTYIRRVSFMNRPF
jgi:prepilin-type N-terminal cleavage/methylation domain-containing protein